MKQNDHRLLNAKVHHTRPGHAKNSFSYRVSYIELALSKINTAQRRPFFGVNHFALLSFYRKDYGFELEINLQEECRNFAKSQGVEDASGEVKVVTMPRLLGYQFNPVSFFFLYDNLGQLKCVIAEVNNTFGERHRYLCQTSASDPIDKDDIFLADKEFHVSPFFDRTGYYRFSFHVDPNQLAIHINYYDSEGQLKLKTSLVGDYQSWGLNGLVYAWFSNPLVSIKAIFLIHWQALKLLFKKAGFRKKPKPKKSLFTKAHQVSSGENSKSKIFLKSQKLSKRQNDVFKSRAI